MKAKSSSTFRLDEQVYLTMGVVALLSVLIFAFRVVTQHPCLPITLSYHANSYEKGNLIGFKAETSNGKNFSWDFGDGTDMEVRDPSTVHKYNNAGKYTVRVTVDGECTEFQSIVITEAPVIDNLSLQPTFRGPDTVYVNQLATYKDFTSMAKSWEWHFEDAVKVDAVTQSASYIYKTPGIKKISLKVNGRIDQVTSMNVYVIDKEAEKIQNQARAREGRPKSSTAKIIYVPTSPTAPPLTSQPSVQQDNNPKKEEEKPKPKAPEIVGPQMEAMLMEVVNGTKRAEDFSPYLNGNLSMSISYNSSSVPFISMCETLKGLKKKKVKSIHVKLYKDASAGFVTYMVVTVDVKKGFLGL